MATEVVSRTNTCNNDSDNSQKLKTALELSMLNLSSNTMAIVADPSNDYVQLDDDSCMLPKVPRSQNITHCVAVPSSEHVAEIVGRQGLCFFFLLLVKLFVCVC